MASSRRSTSSVQSADATIVDPNSAPVSPRKITGHVEQRSCLDVTILEPRPAYAEPLHSSIDGHSKHSVSGQRYGWPRLAEKMAEVPEYAAFPRFGDLNVKNLLYYQVQLKGLRKRILEEEEKVNVSRYDHLVEDADSEYHKLLMDLRSLLRKYNKALLQHSRISALPDPEAYNISSLRRWLGKEEGANCLVRDEQGPDKTWGNVRDIGVPESLLKHFRMVLKALLLSKPPPKAEHDLVATHPENRIDGLSKWIVYNLAPLYWTWRDKREREKQRQRTLALQSTDNSSEKMPNPMAFDAEAQGKALEPEQDQDMRNTVKSMSESTAVRFTSSLSTIVACLLPVVAIAVLTQVKGERNLLLCITAFAIIFAVGLMALTQGTSTRTETFAATAAFSAVLVVFMSQPAVDIQWPAGAERPVINL